MPRFDLPLSDLRDYRPEVRVPADFVMIARVLGTLGGLFVQYRPAIPWARLARFLSPR